MIQDMIENTPEYRTMTTQRQRGTHVGPQGDQTVGDAIDPVLNLEKGDAEFWLNVAQVVLMFLILREVSA